MESSDCYQSIYTIGSREKWVKCASVAAIIYGVIATIIALAISANVYFQAPPESKSSAIVLGVVFLAFIGVYAMYTPIRAARDYDAMKIEQKNLAEKDPKYNNWDEYIKYKQSDSFNHSAVPIGDQFTAGLLIGNLLTRRSPQRSPPHTHPRSTH